MADAMDDEPDSRRVAKDEMLFACKPPGEASIAEAKEYIKRFNLTNEDVKITQGKLGVYIFTKKEIRLRDSQRT